MESNQVVHESNQPNDLHCNLQIVEVAFTGDTCIDFLHVEANSAVFTAKLLIMELTFLDDAVSREGAREKGHMHIDDFVEHADMFQVMLLSVQSNGYECRGLYQADRKHLPFHDKYFENRQCPHSVMRAPPAECSTSSTWFLVHVLCTRNRPARKGKPVETSAWRHQWRRQACTSQCAWAWAFQVTVSEDELACCRMRPSF